MRTTAKLGFRFRLIAIGTCAAALVATTAQAQQSADEIRLAEEQAMKTAVATIAPSVVRIETFGGLERVGEQAIAAGPTTGTVVSEDGFVLSSAFNFIQQPSSILVSLPSGKRAAAEIVARDNSRMLVLLKVNTEEKLPVPEFVDPQEMIVGQWSLAVGRTFDPQRPNMSVGILSALDRIWGKAIQTDARVSPSNYGGPLIDIRGRVLGILVPMSPQGGDGAHGQPAEVAGAEWYDSGIGFAVPVVGLLTHLEKLKQGESLQPGLLGVRLKGNNLYADPAEIAVSQANSPAYEAGLRAKDVILAANDRAIDRQAQLKHALGPLYAGDVVKLTVKRGDQQLDFDVTLTDHIDPYEHPWLGLLPMRGPVPEAGGVPVRYLFPESPAIEAGVEPGDVITAVAGEAVADRAALIERLVTQSRDEPVQLTIRRGEETKPIELKLATLSAETPGELPPAVPELPAVEGEQPKTGLIDIKIPEEKNDCVAFVPENYRADLPHGLVVWIHPAGGYKPETLEGRWKVHAERDHFIVLAPQSADPARWTPTEVDFLRKTIEATLDRYNIDRSRVMVHGYQAGAAMAYLLAFTQPELVRGLAVVDSAVPRLAPVPDNDPINRLMIYSVAPTGSKAAPLIEKTVERLREMKFPVEAKTIDGDSRDLSSSELGDLLRWFDSLDRL
ncbi:MAG: PDZ domain-containing protein [Pirellulaceae bacterium]